MIMTDAGMAAMPMGSRGPLRTLFSWLGLSTLMDDPAGSEPAAGPVSAPERDWQHARIASHRAMLAAQRGEYESAEFFFTAAFSLDASLRPAQIADFWTLGLPGLEAAQRALNGAGRQDDAVALGSEIAYRFGHHPARRPVRAAS
jgi:hypothetical protein